MAAGGPHPSAWYVERQALTRIPATPATPSGLTSNVAAYQTPPPEGTTLTGDGLVLGGISSLMVSVYPWATATLSGAGTLLCWYYNPFVGRWTRMSDLDLDLSDALNFPAKSFVANRNFSKAGGLINWLTSGVTVSGGTTDVLVRIDANSSVLGQSA